MKTKLQRFSLVAVAFVTALIVCGQENVFAAQQGLTSLFDTQAFQGNMSMFSNMNWVGKIISSAISIISLFGLASVVLKVMITLLYLSARNLWDEVDDAKQSSKGGKFFGFKNAAIKAWDGDKGVGLDSIISFILTLLPNVKAYSEFASSNKHQVKGLQEDDNITAYLLKSALPNIMAILAFTMGFSGVLWQAYGAVVDSVHTVAKSYVDERFDSHLMNLLKTGNRYNFGYSADGTKYGSFKQSVADKMSRTILSRCQNYTTDTQMEVGVRVQDFVDKKLDYLAYKALGKFDGAGLSYDNKSGSPDDVNIAEAYENGALTEAAKNAIKQNPLTDREVSNLQFNVVLNNSPTYVGAESTDVSEFGIGSVEGNEQPYYIHLFVSKKRLSDETDYFAVMKETTSSTNKSNSSSGGLSETGR